MLAQDWATCSISGQRDSTAKWEASDAIKLSSRPCEIFAAETLFVAFFSRRHHFSPFIWEDGKVQLSRRWKRGNLKVVECAFSQKRGVPAKKIKIILDFFPKKLASSRCSTLMRSFLRQKSFPKVRD
jgi:hypothetical protein